MRKVFLLFFDYHPIIILMILESALMEEEFHDENMAGDCDEKWFAEESDFGDRDFWEHGF
jgi:hypothetical protein